MTRIPTVRDAMSNWYFTLTPEMDVYDAISALLRKRASCAPVLDNGELAGILTEKDCVRVLANSAYEELARGTVADYMSTPPLTIEIDTDLFTAAKQFVMTNFTAVPVTDHGLLAGRLSRQDVLVIVDRMSGARRAELAREAGLSFTPDAPQGIAAMQRAAASHGPEQLAAIMSQRHAGQG
jgi:CBS domain-containing protein